MPGGSRLSLATWLTALAMTALLLGGCGAWRTQGQAPATVVSSSAMPLNARVTLQDGTKREIYRAVVRGDSLVGAATDPTAGRAYGSAPRPPGQPDSIAVALSDIRAIEIRTVDPGKTALFVFGLLVAAAGVVVLFVAADWDL